MFDCARWELPQVLIAAFIVLSVLGGLVYLDCHIMGVRKAKCLELRLVWFKKHCFKPVDPRGSKTCPDKTLSVGTACLSLVELDLWGEAGNKPLGYVSDRKRF
jgi:hypothetical protein